MISHQHAMFLCAVDTAIPAAMSAQDERAAMIVATKAGHVTWLQINADISPELTDDGRLALAAWKEAKGIREMGEVA